MVHLPRYYQPLFGLEKAAEIEPKVWAGFIRMEHLNVQIALSKSLCHTLLYPLLNILLKVCLEAFDHCQLTVASISSVTFKSETK